MPVPILMDTNMAARNQQKHLSLFAKKSVGNFPLEELKTIKLIQLLMQELFR